MDLPGALARKYPKANRELAWQYLFPAARRSSVVDINGQSREQRYHVNQRFSKELVDAKQNIRSVRSENKLAQQIGNAHDNLMKKLALILTLAALPSICLMRAQENKVVGPRGKSHIVVPKGKTYVKLNAKGKEIARFTAGQTMAKEGDCAVIPCPASFDKGITCWHCKARPEPTPTPPAKAQ